MKPNTAKTLRFPLKTQKRFRFRLKIMNHYLLKKFTLLFCQNWNNVFFLWKIYWNFWKLCSVINKSDTLNLPTLSAGIMGYTEIPITPVKPSHYRIDDSTTLIHWVVRTYHPVITEPNFVQYQDIKQIKKFFRW